MAYEISRVVFTCPADALVGDAVYISGVRTVSYADVDDAAKYPNAVIMDKISATTCILSGRNSVIGGLVGLTTGSYYYLTNTATAGNTLSLVASAFIVALAISTTELRVELDAVIATHIAAANPHAGSAPTAHSHLDGEVDNGITLTNITQITGRSHTDLTDIGLTAHGGIDTHIGDANPHTGSQPLDAQLTALALFTVAEVSQLANIGVITISSAQWGYLGAMDQGVTTALLTTLAESVITAEIVGGQSIDNAIDALIGIHVLVAAAHHTKYALTDDLAAGEITQLQAIGAATISAGQWGYLGAMDQGVTTALLTTLAESVITAEIVGGQSIDNAIDALIGIHVLVAAAHHTKYALTDDLAAGEITQLQAIGAATMTAAQWLVVGGLVAVGSGTIISAAERTAIGTNTTAIGLNTTHRGLTGEGSIHHTKYALTNDLAAGEITQLQAIGAATMTAAQWLVVGGLVAVGSGTIISAAERTAIGTNTTAIGLNTTHRGLTGEGSIHHTKYALTNDLAAGEITQLQAIGAVTISLAQWGYLGATSEDIQTHMSAANPHSGSQPLDAQLTALALFDVTEITQLANIGATTISAGQWGYLGAMTAITAEIENLTVVEIQQLEAIGAVTISLAQWGYVGAMNQGVTTALLTTLIENTITAEIVGGQSIDNAIDTLIGDHAGVAGIHHAKYLITDTFAAGEVTQLQNIGGTTISAAQWGYVGAMNQGVTTALLTTLIENTITAEIVGGQSIDNAIDTLIGDHAGVAGIHHAKYLITDTFAAGEVTQLQNIGGTTISAAQWGYLGGLDQALTASSNVTFNQLTIVNVGAGANPILTSNSAAKTLTVADNLTATKVYNAVYNDYADYWGRLFEGEEAIPGKVYVALPGRRVAIATKRADKACIGICSDTYGFASGQEVGDVPIGVAGFVKAYVDDEYPIGTQLVNDEHGNLTKATLRERLLNYVIAKYIETADDDRYWVKII